MSVIKDFFSRVPGAIKGHINLDEICRIFVLAMLAHQGVIGILSAVDANPGRVFVNPEDAALYTAWAAAIVETMRRIHQGFDPVATLHALNASRITEGDIVRMERMERVASLEAENAATPSSP